MHNANVKETTPMKPANANLAQRPFKLCFCMSYKRLAEAVEKIGEKLRNVLRVTDTLSALTMHRGLWYRMQCVVAAVVVGGGGTFYLLTYYLHEEADLSRKSPNHRSFHGCYNTTQVRFCSFFSHFYLFISK